MKKIKNVYMVKNRKRRRVIRKKLFNKLVDLVILSIIALQQDAEKYNENHNSEFHRQYERILTKGA